MKSEPSPPSDARGRRAAALAIVIGLCACFALFFVLRRPPPPLARPPAPKTAPAPTPAPVVEEEAFAPLPLPAPSGSAHAPSGIGDRITGISTCEKFFKPIPETCRRETDAVSRLVHASHWYGIAASPCYAAAPTGPAWKKDVESALAAILADPPDSSSVGERILAQNAALRIALCAVDPLATEAPASASPLGKAASAVVRHLALTPEEAAIVAPADNEPLPFLLGSPDAREAGLQNFPIAHEWGSAFTHWARIFKVRNFAVNVAHAMIVDRAGTPRPTSVVDRVAVRVLSAGVPRVCLAEADPSLLRCGVPAGLAPVASFGQPPLPGSTDVSKGVPCGGCHTHPEHLGSTLESESELRKNLDARSSRIASALAGRLQYLHLDVAASTGPR